MTWTRYAAWSRLLFFPGFALFIACAAAPKQHGLLAWLRFLGWCVGIVILLGGLPVLIKQLARYERSVGLAPRRGIARLAGANHGSCRTLPCFDAADHRSIWG